MQMTRKAGALQVQRSIVECVVGWGLHRMLSGLSASQFATRCGWPWLNGSVGFSLGAMKARDELSNLVEAQTDHSTIGPGVHMSKHHAFLPMCRMFVNGPCLYGL